MKRLFFNILLPLITLMVSCDNQKIVILFDNDVHCAVYGYTKIASVKDSLKSAGIDVLTVSNGDFLSGGIHGNYSKGMFIVRYVNAVGYDAITIGNHEFDYTPKRMKQTLELIRCQKVCCNIKEKEQNIFPCYTIINAGKKKIAFIGVTTPTTLTSSDTSIFLDSLGNSTYSFCNDSIIPIVQENADKARNEGADYVVVLSHLGDKFNPVLTSRELISKTEGINAVLDGHEHHVIQCDTVRNKIGEPVILSSTGDLFRNIGMLEICGKQITSKLIPTKSINGSNKQVDDIDKEIEPILTRLTKNKIIGQTSSDITNSIRNRENALGDLVTDALRAKFDAEVAFVNSGFIRADLKKGDIDICDVFTSCPFGDFGFLTEVKGQEILDMLEMGSSNAPKPSGGFMQVSGMRYSIDTNIMSTVVKDSSGIFVKVSGERRVHNVEIMDKNGSYKPIDPTKSYNIASIDFILVKNGDGIRFSEGLKNNSELYYTIDIIADYIQSINNGILGDRYSTTDDRITYKPKN